MLLIVPSKNDLHKISKLCIIHRGKIADAANNGTECTSTRMIPLKETNTCNSETCPAGKMFSHTMPISFICHDLADSPKPLSCLDTN